MDLIAPYEFLEIWQQSIKTEYIELCIIAEENKPISCSNSHFKLFPDYSFATAPALDYLFIPGGSGRHIETANLNTINFIKKQAENCKLILSICTGTFLLQKAGLLENTPATTYWRALAEFKALHPQVVEQRIVKSGKIWTAGEFPVELT
jgi:transcriptional regulator GlxA family with amidase domain